MEGLRIVKVLLMFFILQWNVRSLIANRQEFKRFVQKLTNKPDIICIQETWLKPNLEFILKGYQNISVDREKDRGVVASHLSKKGYHLDTLTQLS